MSLYTLGAYLVGDRKAILELAGDWRTLPVSLLFVFSAALAREYDGRNLLAEPHHLALPFVASLSASVLLFIVCFVLPLASAGVPTSLDAKALGLFTGLFLMTAPLAWIYVIPFEQFLSPLAALQLNLVLLGIGSVWRVVLISRVIAVLTGRTWWIAFVRVLFVSCVVLVAASSALDVPLFLIMGGIRMTPSEELLFELKGATICSGIVAGLVVPAPVSLTRLGPAHD
jgi:hypothetical protein